MHGGKTKILFNGVGRNVGPAPGVVNVAGDEIEVLPGDRNTMYLGRALSLQSVQDTEIKHRMSRAWDKFAVYQKELTNNTYLLTSRRKLFNSVVTASALYGCGSWTVTNERERLVKTTQMEMLRRILGSQRRRKMDDASSSDQTNPELGDDENDSKDGDLES